MRAFVAQPMWGKTDAEINAVRKKAQRILNEYFGKVEILDFKYEPDNVAHSHEYVANLSKVLKVMSDADIVYFAPGWNTDRECVVEDMVANLFGISTIIEEA